MFSDKDLVAIYKDPKSSHRIAFESLGIDTRGIFSLGTVRISEDTATYSSDAAHISVIRSEFISKIDSLKNSIAKVYDPYSRGEQEGFNLYKVRSSPQSYFGQIMEIEFVRHDENSI
jgi:hypothetical protein